MCATDAPVFWSGALSRQVFEFVSFRIAARCCLFASACGAASGSDRKLVGKDRKHVAFGQAEKRANRRVFFVCGGPQRLFPGVLRAALSWRRKKSASRAERALSASDRSGSSAGGNFWAGEGVAGALRVRGEAFCLPNRYSEKLFMNFSPFLQKYRDSGMFFV